MAVEVEEAEEDEAIEDEELDREMVLRGTNMPRMSSGFIALSVCPPLMPHAGRFRFAKLGGFATAVMRKGCVKGYMSARVDMMEISDGLRMVMQMGEER